MLGVLFWSRVRHNVETLGLGVLLRKLAIKSSASHGCFDLVPFPVWFRFGTTDLPLLNAVFGIEEMCRFGLPSSAQVIVDAGANIGLTSVYYSDSFPKARIVALEPEAGNFEMLRRNVTPYPDIVRIQAALWSHDGTVAILSPGSR